MELAKNAKKNADANAIEMKKNGTVEKREQVRARIQKELDLTQNGGDQINPANPILTSGKKAELNPTSYNDDSTQTRESTIDGEFEIDPGINQSDCDSFSGEV